MKNPWSRAPRRFARSRTIGVGEACFDTAVERLMTWHAQQSAGFDVEPPTRVAQGGEHVLVTGRGRLRVHAPVHIREVIDDAENGWQRKGFVYETRRGHPVSGHESFIVERHLTTDEVRFVVAATSVPGRWWVWLGAPVARLAQDVAARRYLAALAES